MAVNISFIGGAGWQFFDDNGDPLSGGKIYTYAAGTTTPLATYTSRSGSTPNANPIILDAAGRTPQEIWSTEGLLYKYVVKTAADVLIRSWDNIGGSVVASNLAQDLADTSSNAKGDALVGFRQSNSAGFLLGAVGKTVNDKLQELVSVKDFGAIGDGVVDDTAAVHAAIDYAKSKRASVFFPTGTYRVTSGYTQDVAFADVRLYGEGSTRETNNLSVNGVAGSHIRLDSSNTNSFFYRANAAHHLQVENLLFSCAQFVIDRKFFVFNAVSNSFSFNNLNFEDVEKPICFEVGCYFQSSSVTNVQFRSSGTLHSQSGIGAEGELRGTFLVLIDVHHEGSVPANTEKIVCNLSGIRQIQGINFLLEGANPGVDWTILRLQNPYDADWSRFPMATFHGFWSEWAGSEAQYAVHQSGGRVVLQSPNQFATLNSKYKLDNRGAVELHNATFSGTDDPVSGYFDLENYLCQVAIYDTNARNFGTTKTNPRYTLINCSEARDGASLPLIGTNFSNIKSQTLWQFDGGNINAGQVQVESFTLGAIYPSVDATYGRKFVVTPAAGGDVNIRFQARVFGKTEAGQQWTCALRLKTPVITSGFLQVSWVDDSTNIGVVTSLASDQEYSLIFSASDTNGGSSLLGFSIASINVTGVTGTLDIYHAAIYLGKDAPQTTIPSYGTNVVTYATAIPTLGEWKRGDIVWDSTPSAGGIPGWVCTASGTPGTWRSMANLA